MAKKRGSAKRIPKKKKSIKFIVIKYVVMLMLVIALMAGGLVWSVYAGLWGELPDYKELKGIRNYEASTLYSEDGEQLGKYYIENRTNVGFDHISPNAINALVATEDARFYEHKGIDPISILRVFFKTMLLGDSNSGGGSTLSQQLAKNLYPREEQQVTFMPVVKLKENFTAYRLENIYTKDEILALYLNTVPFGDNTFGIESATRRYFSTSASDLSVPQAATLIGMLKGPTRYNPRLHPERALQRRNTVIGQMVKYDFLSDAQGSELKDSDLALSYTTMNQYTGLAPYLRERIRQDAEKIISDYNSIYGTSYNLYKDGLVLTSTIDAEMQRYAEDAIAKHMKTLQHSFYTYWDKREPWQDNPQVLTNAVKRSPAYLRLQKEGLDEKEIMHRMNERKPIMVYSAYQGETRMEMSPNDSIKHYLKILHPGMIAVEPSTGKVKAWVGGLDYKYFQYDQVTAPRQVGSVFKPVVYSAAIRHGAQLDAYYKNEQKVYPEYDNWSPRNSDNNYEGFYTLKGALSKSINTIAVEVLLQTGIDTVIDHARRLGIRSELPPYPSLALGVADIPLQEMVKPFAVFANNGRLAEQYYLSEIKDSKGNVIYKAPMSSAVEVLPAAEANVMSNILTDVVDEGTGQRLRSVYGLQNEMAGKTGTTQNHVDGWFIGYNPRIVVGIRVGANDVNVHFNTISLGQGANMALPAFGLFMQSCLQSHTYGHWSQLAFPVPYLLNEKDLEVPVFKEHLNLFDRMTNQKLEKRDLPVQDVQEKIESEEQPAKKGFFKRLFGGKK